MSRIRSVHPGLFTDEGFVSCSPIARLLLIGLWTEADDQGLFEWKPITIKMRLFPADNADVVLLLAELLEQGFVRQYEIGDKQFGALRNFRKFQRPKSPNAIHPLPDNFRSYVGLSESTSETDRVKATPIPPKGEKSPQMEDGGKGERKRGKKIVDKSTPKNTPLSVLSPSLGRVLAQDVIEHRKQLRKPMTAKAAELLAGQLEKCGDPKAGAEMMIERGWQGFRADWFANARSGLNGGAQPQERMASDGIMAEARAERAKAAAGGGR